MTRRGEQNGAVVLEEASMEDLIESLSVMAEQNVILAKGVQKKVEALRNVREERNRRAAEAGGAGGRRHGDPPARSD